MRNPKGFRGFKTLHWVRASADAPPFAGATRPQKGARAKGIVYERRGHEHFRSLYGDRYIPNPWLRFNADNQLRWCQPDALLFNFETGVITLLEFKYQHTHRAWWQLTQLYLPLLQRLFPKELWTFKLVEVVKWYDPATAFPCRTQLLRTLEAPLHEAVGVHIWKPRGRK